MTSDTVAGSLAVALGAAMIAVTPIQVGKPVLVFGAAPSSLAPASYPLVVAALIIVFGAAVAGRGLRHARPASWAATNPGAYANVAVLLVLMLVYALTFVPLGFVLASFLAMMLTNLFLGNRSHLLGLLFAAAVPLAIFNLFTSGMKVLLPAAPFAAWLGFM